MQSDRTASANGHRVSAPGSSTGLESLQVKCRRQAVAIDTLSEAVSTFRRGATALKAENAELRAELAGLRERRRRDLVEMAVALDALAPGAARRFVVQRLERRVDPTALDNAQIVVTELVTNSLLHGGAPMDEVVVSVQVMPDSFRVGVHDSGSHAVFAVGPPDLETGGGFGLNLVQGLSDRWGFERLAAGGTQVWAQLPRTSA